MRYKQENVLLIGLIPGPKEPDHDINSFLNPMVDELKKFWSGRKLICGSQRQTKMFRCALLCIACDIPPRLLVPGASSGFLVTLETLTFQDLIEKTGPRGIVKIIDVLQWESHF